MQQINDARDDPNRFLDQPQQRTNQQRGIYTPRTLSIHVDYIVIATVRILQHRPQHAITVSHVAHCNT